MSWEVISLLLGGLGIGSTITTVIQGYANAKNEKKKRLYEERKEAYMGILT